MFVVDVLMQQCYWYSLNMYSTCSFIDCMTLHSGGKEGKGVRRGGG